MATVISTPAERLQNHPGTVEQHWREHPRMAQVPEVGAAQLVPAGSRAVVVAPHPDDEVLGCAGLLMALAQAGRDILLIAVSDGEGSHASGSAMSAGLLAQLRPAETIAALGVLELVQVDIMRANIPDSRVAEHRLKLQDLLLAYVQRSDTLLASWHLDGHPDHDAVGEVCRDVGRRIGCHVIEVPVWLWHWRQPDDGDIPWHSARKLALDQEQVERKAQALQCYRSQLEPDLSTGNAAVLSNEVLAHFLRPYEIYFV
ncbi:PIG-L deacetylase family protein [Herbaspirillum autotrophicum]|uniref:PIG-L deacetylase family protein n=1 Tax=Herbaspirillum autotrophicum TaxID=180195 RepID=UPI00067B73AD|nr:PIG-L family deacetylase [Herbaspirillum autotrophicum]